MAERGGPHKKWVKPSIERVDMIESEVALVSCKASTKIAHTGPNSGTKACNTTCKTIGNS